VIGLFSPLIDQLTRGLTFATARHLVLAKNIANSETPGYRPRDLVFDDFLEDHLKVRPGLGTGELTPDPGPEALAATQYIQLADGPARHDGNTVHMDKQMARIAENTLYQNTLTQLLVGQFTKLKMAISGRV
jgi:flagellar basal-body rod protein FlgB